MNKPNIYITRKMPAEILEPYESQFNIRMWHEESNPVPRDVLMTEIQKADGIVCLLTETIDETIINQNLQLKIIANMAVGYDNIDVLSASKQGIVVTNTPDVLTDTTADLTFALLLATARRIVEASRIVKNDQWGDWSPYFLAGTDIHHKTIGIVGMGRIGEAVARRAKGFDMSILYHNRSRKYQTEKELQATYAGFDELLEKSDFVVSLIPLANETKHLFNREAFKKMKSTAIFINVSRGQVVDEEALYKALKNNEIKAAGLDVFEEEPIKGNHPLLALNNVVCIPHIGSATMETRTRMVELCLENISGFFYGEGPITPVT